MRVTGASVRAGGADSGLRNNVSFDQCEQEMPVLQGVACDEQVQ